MKEPKNHQPYGKEPPKEAELCYPIIFYEDKPSGHPLDSRGTLPEVLPVKESAPTQVPPVPHSKPCEDDGYIPSFCRAPTSAATESPKPVLAQNAPPFSPVSLPYSCSEPIPSAFSITQFDQTAVPNKSPSPKEPRQSAVPHAYDIAMELMATQPLRMVDNALYAYDGQVYRFVSASTMNRLIMHLCRAYVRVVGDSSIIKKVYEIIQAEPNICIPHANTIPLVALDDGLLDLTTLALGQFSPAPFVTVKLLGSYSRGQVSSCPAFDRFLHEITGGDSTLEARIWEAVGYSLVPDTNGKCFILFQGVPDSGKSLLGDVIAALIDPDLVTSMDISTMGERFGPSELVGKQLCLALDMPSGTLDAKLVSLFKNLTGGDFVTADVKYQARIKFRCSATFVLATNHLLRTRDNDPAFFRRAVTIPFRFSVDKGQQDHSLKARILAERDAIIYRAIQAYVRLRQNKYQFSGDFEPNEVVAGQSNTSNSLTNALHIFCRQFCIADAMAFTPTAVLYDAFCTYAQTTWPGRVRSFSDEAFRILGTLFPQQVCRDRKRPKGAKATQSAERGFAGIALSYPSADENLAEKLPQ